MIDLSCSLLTILSLITFVGLYYIIRVENKGDGKKGFTGDREGEAPEIIMDPK